MLLMPFTALHVFVFTRPLAVKVRLTSATHHTSHVTRQVLVTTPEQGGRCVLLVPFADDWPSSNDGGRGTSMRRVVDIWCSTAEFLEIHAGDWEEHAVLPCNYLLHLGLGCGAGPGRS
jgi:hypothetical protein